MKKHENELAKTERAEFRLTRAHKEKLERAAKERHRTVSELVRQWIERLD